MKKKKDEAIVEAALKLFKEKGYSAVRIADIAREAQVGKGTVYEYFTSKEELLQKACSLSCNKTGESIEFIISREEDLTHPVKIVHRSLEVVLTQLLSFSNEENKLFYELSLLAANSPDIKELVRQDFQSKIKQWQKVTLSDYQRGLDSGHFRYIDKPQDLAEFMVATVDGLMWQMQWHHKDQLQDQAKRMVNVYCQLIMTEPEKLQEYLK